MMFDAKWTHLSALEESKTNLDSSRTKHLKMQQRINRQAQSFKKKFKGIKTSACVRVPKSNFISKVLHIVGKQRNLQKSGSFIGLEHESNVEITNAQVTVAWFSNYR